MALRLKFRIPAQQLALALKALVFGGFLGLAAIGDFSIIPVLFFVVAAIILYATPVFNTVAYSASFLALIIFSLGVHIHFSGAATLVLVLFSSLLFYMLIGLKNIYFTIRERWHYLYLLGISLLMFLVFFSADKSNIFFLQLAIVFITQFLLWREFFSLNTNDIDFLSPNALFLTTAVIAYLITQISWIAVVLPLGLLHAVNLSVLSLVILTDTVVKYLKSSLSRNAALMNVTIFIIFAILIFATG